MVEASPVKRPEATDRRIRLEWLPNCTGQVKRGATEKRDEMEHAGGCRTARGSGKRNGVAKFTPDKEAPSAPQQWRRQQTGATAKEQRHRHQRATSGGSHL